MHAVAVSNEDKDMWRIYLEHQVRLRDEFTIAVTCHLLSSLLLSVLVAVHVAHLPGAPGATAR